MDIVTSHNVNMHTNKKSVSQEVITLDTFLKKFLFTIYTDAFLSLDVFLFHCIYCLHEFFHLLEVCRTVFFDVVLHVGGSVSMVMELLRYIIEENGVVRQADPRRAR